MSERNSVEYENMNSVLNYVSKEYEKWQEKYEIPYEDEFNIKLLLQLRFDILHTKPELTKTKIDLIEMAQRIQSRLRLKEKTKTYNIMYVDYLYNTKPHLRKVIVYLNNKVYFLIGKYNKTMNDFADVIKSLAVKEKSTIYMDNRGYGRSLYDILCNYDNLIVKEIKYINIQI